MLHVWVCNAIQDWEINCGVKFETIPLPQSLKTLITHSGLRFPDRKHNSKIIFKDDSNFLIKYSIKHFNSLCYYITLTHNKDNFFCVSSHNTFEIFKRITLGHLLRPNDEDFYCNDDEKNIPVYKEEIVCTCSNSDLFNHGCKCGVFKKEMKI